MATQVQVEALPTIVLPDRGTCWTSERSLTVAQSMDVACSRFGYFRLENHGIALDSIQSAIQESRAFFSRASSEKAGYTAGVETQFLGYRCLGAEKSLFHGGAEACEQYRIGCFHASKSDMASIAGHFHQPFTCSTALFASMVDLGDRLLALAALGQEALDCFAPFFESPMHRLGLNYYEPGAGERIGNSVSYGMSPHVDRAVFTIVIQDELGLELLSPEGDWLTMPVGPDVLIGFIGDYLQRWTNGRYRAVEHRVGKIRRDRISVQYKHKPSYAVVVEPLARFLSADGDPVRYEPFDTGIQYERLLSELLSQ